MVKCLQANILQDLNAYIITALRAYGVISAERILYTDLMAYTITALRAYGIMYPMKKQRRFRLILGKP